MVTYGHGLTVPSYFLTIRDIAWHYVTLRVRIWGMSSLTTEFLTAEAIGKILGLQPRTVVLKLRKAGVPEIMVGKDPRFLKKDFERYLVSTRKVRS